MNKKTRKITPSLGPLLTISSVAALSLIGVVGSSSVNATNTNVEVNVDTGGYDNSYAGYTRGGHIRTTSIENLVQTIFSRTNSTQGTTYEIFTGYPDRVIKIYTGYGKLYSPQFRGEITFYSLDSFLRSYAQDGSGLIRYRYYNGILDPYARQMLWQIPPPPIAYEDGYYSY
ncbi:hypothetical protein [Pasteuria penetrans]|uniref:hypothetical protein n=1 Tax=Pasteuria penetrans TaxID=86005 RepID=UPI000F974DE1|nr:hypothetical protein [Pasteuria penetrans]